MDVLTPRMVWDLLWDEMIYLRILNPLNKSFPFFASELHIFLAEPEIWHFLEVILQGQDHPNLPTCLMTECSSVTFKKNKAKCAQGLPLTFSGDNKWTFLAWLCWGHCHRQYKTLLAVQLLKGCHSGHGVVLRKCPSADAQACAGCGEKITIMA